MALPTRGQSDWDDELGNHIAGLEASVQSAVANAVVAVSNANEARNVAQSVQNAVLGGVDEAIATLLPSFASIAEAEEALGNGTLSVGQTFFITGA